MMKIISGISYALWGTLCHNGIDCQSNVFMSNRFLKDKIDGVRVTQFQLAYIRDTTHNSHKNLVTLCREVNYMWRGNQDLEMQEWEDCTNPNKTRMIAIIMLVSKNKPQGSN